MGGAQVSGAVEVPRGAWWDEWVSGLGELCLFKHSSGRTRGWGTGWVRWLLVGWEYVIKVSNGLFTSFEARLGLKLHLIVW